MIDLTEAIQQLEEIVRRMEEHLPCDQSGNCAICDDISIDLMYSQIEPQHYRAIIYAARETFEERFCGCRVSVTDATEPD